MSEKTIEYDDIDAIRGVLEGRKIVSSEHKNLGSYNGTIRFTLDNGTVLVASEADGGCACENGCFTLEKPEIPDNVITRVEFAESKGGWGEGHIEIFVFTESGKFTIIDSEGSDNGYYGWGYTLHIEEIEEKE